MLDDFTGIASFCWSLRPDSARSNFFVMEPENEGLEDEFPFQRRDFQGCNISFWAILGFPAFLQTWSVWSMLSDSSASHSQLRKADAMCKEAEAKAEHCPLMRLFRGFVWDGKTTQLCGDFQRP